MKRSTATAHFGFALALGLPLAVAACGHDVDEGATMGALLDAPANDDEQAVHAVCGAGATVFGVDVSSWQDTINWGSVKSAGV